MDAATRRWALAASGSEQIVRAEPLHGGISSSITVLTVRAEDGSVRELVLREIDRPPWSDAGAELIEREAATLIRLAASVVPAPRLVGWDPGVQSRRPSLLMTRLAGAPRLADPDLEALARTLVAIHEVQPDTLPQDVEVWVDPADWRTPEWAPADGVFLHRDYHPGNVLFDGDVVSGVVDWVETSWGPADVDVAHCLTNLVLLCGGATAARWPAAYSVAGGKTSAQLRQWCMIDAVSMLRNLDRIVAGWTAAGRDDLTLDGVRAAMEDHLAALML